MVWWVIAGPALVVVAGLVTVWIAARDPDPIVPFARDQRAISAGAAAVPAQQARNHAATAR